jgi:hypothetical protein
MPTKNLKYCLYILSLLFISDLNAQLLPEWGIGLNNKTESLRINDVVDDGAGNYYAIGSYENTEIDGLTFESQGSNNDVIIMKMNANGDVLWKKRIGGDGTDTGMAISYFNGKIYIAALVRNSFNLNTPYQRGLNDLVVPDDVLSTLLVSYNSDGEVQWSKLLDASDTVFPKSILANNLGLFLVGNLIGSTDFQSISESGGTTYSTIGMLDKGFLIRYDLNGNLIWANLLNCADEVFVHDVSHYGDGLYITGYYKGQLNTEGEAGTLNNILNSGAVIDNFLIKYDINGTFKWARRFGNKGFFDGMSVLALENQIFVSGGYNGHINFNTPALFNGSNELNSSDYESFLVEYDSLGTVDWIRRFGPLDISERTEVKSLNGRLYVNSTSQGTLNFSTPYDPLKLSYPLSPVARNGFIAEYMLNGTFVSGRIFNSSKNSSSQAYHPSSQGLVSFSEIENDLIITDIHQQKEDSLYSKSSRILQTHFVPDLLPNWQKNYGDVQTTGGYESIAIATDGLGNTYTTGYFNMGVRFGTLPILYSSGGKDIFIVKKDGEGTPIWSKRAGGSGDDEPQDITFSDGYVYITGSFENTANFNTPSSGTNELISAGGKDVFVWRLRQLDGVQFMLKRAGGLTDDEGKGIAVLNSEIYVSGKFTLTANFNTPSMGGTNQISSAGGTDAFLVKYTSSGNIDWIKRAGGTGDDAGNSVGLNGTVAYMGGYYEGAANFNTPSAFGSNQILSAGEKDVFLVKYSSSGALNFIRTAGGSFDDQLFDLSTYGNDVYITGFFTDQAYFPGPVIQGLPLLGQGQRDAYLVKYSSTGLPQWRRRMGGTLNDAGTTMAIENEIISLGGYFRNTRNFDNYSEIWPESYVSDGLRDGFLGRFGTNGALLTTKRIGGIGDDLLHGLAFDGHHTFICGSSDEQMNFNTPSNNSMNVLGKVGEPYAFIAALVWTHKYDHSKIQGRDSFLPVYTDDLVVDELGNQYVVGRFSDLIKVGTLELENTHEYNKSLFMLKLDARAKPQWIKELAFGPDINSAKMEYYEGQIFVHIDADQDSLFIKSGSAYFTLKGNQLVWFDTTGTYISKKRIYSDIEDMAGAAGNIYLYGDFSEKLYFENAGLKDSLEISGVYSDAFILNYNRNGSLNWAKRFGGETGDYASKIAAFNNRIYLSGNFNDSLNFKTPSLYDVNTLYESASGTGVFLAALDFLGNVVWARRQDNTFANKLFKSSIVAHANGVYAINKTEEPIVNLSSPYQAGINEYDALAKGRILVQSYNSTGLINWVKIIGDTTYFLENDIIHGAMLGDKLVFGGKNQHKLNFSDPYVHGTMELPEENTYLCSFNASGTLEWYQSQGGFGIDIMDKLISQGSSLYALTDLSEFISFSNNALEIDNNERLSLIKLSPCGTVSNLQSTAGDINLGYHFIYGNSLTASNDIKEKAEVEYKANAITLEPGFSASPGTVFKANTGGCN